MTQFNLFESIATVTKPSPEVSRDLLDLNHKVTVWYVVGPMVSGDEIHYLVKEHQAHPCANYEEFKRDRDRTHALKVVGGFFADRRSAIKCAEFHKEMTVIREYGFYRKSVSR